MCVCACAAQCLSLFQPSEPTLIEENVRVSATAPLAIEFVTAFDFLVIARIETTIQMIEYIADVVTLLGCLALMLKDGEQVVDVG